jgi:subfamily B ATP-binding cassette protein MsbA
MTYSRRTAMRSFVFKLWQIIRPYRKRFFGGTLLGMLAGLKDPLLVGSIYLIFAVVFRQEGSHEIDGAIHKVTEFSPVIGHWLAGSIQRLASHPTLLTALSVFAVLPLTMMIGGLVNYGYVYYMQWVGVRSIGDLRAQVYEHLLYMPHGFLQKQSTGEMMARISNDVSTLHTLMSNSLVSIVRDPITLVVLIGGNIAFQPRLTLLSLIILPVSLVPVITFTRKLKKSSEAAQTANAAVFRSMHEGLTGARVVKAYNLEPVVLAEFRSRVHGYCNQYMRTVRAGEIPGPLIEFCGAIGVTGLLAAIALTRGDTTAAGFLGFILSIQMSYTRLKYIVRMFTQIVQARAASTRVFQILDTPSNLPEPAIPKALRGVGAEIRFEHVTFGYDDRKLFDDFNLVVKPGQLVALVGQSGSGKTTLTNLLLRFYDPQGGAVTIGGTDIREVSSRDLRSQIAVVTQETILFNESVRRNIELGRPGSSDADIREAARHAHADEFIRESPQGYDTLIGEKGANLSGGQRQRLAIARAILKNAPILILDEATSALDTESERAVQAALNDLMQGRTTICIAHRLSTIQHADVIVVLDRGRIVETGTHKELLSRGGLYQKLYQLQFRD